jgi:hypothetical protein
VWWQNAPTNDNEEMVFVGFKISQINIPPPLLQFAIPRVQPDMFACPVKSNASFHHAHQSTNVCRLPQIPMTIQSIEMFRMAQINRDEGLK